MGSEEKEGSNVSNRRFSGSRTQVFLAIALLAACQQAPPSSPTGEAAKSGPEWQPEPRRATQQFTIDVDPVRAAAFERATEAGQLRLALDSPTVSHDPATDRTTVTLHVTNAGTALSDLRLRVADPAHLVSAPASPRALEVAGARQALTWVFDNPGAASFSFHVGFTGTPGQRALLALVPASGATASSTYGTLVPGRAIDGNLSTQWANDGYRAPEAWLRIDTGAVRSLGSLAVKMQPQSGGAFYRIETSNDGVAFTAATGNLKNASWNLETKALPAGTQGRYVRLHFFNDAASPEIRFSVFEVRVDGGGGGTATPTPVPTGTPTPGATPTPAVTPTPGATPTPTTSLPPAGTYGNTFEALALGAAPSEYIDPRDEGYSYSWMPRVAWSIVSYNGSRQYEHNAFASTSLLSFRRYRGTALGTPNGQLPARYFAQVDVTPIRSGSYSPTGDQGTQFYYLDPTHYLELLIKPTLFEVWVANGAEPFTSRNWQRIHYTTTTTSAGQRRRLSAEIDANAHTMRCYLDGQLRATVSHPMLNTQTHFFALRGAGNVVVHDNVTIQPR